MSTPTSEFYEGEKFSHRDTGDENDYPPSFFDSKKPPHHPHETRRMRVEEEAREAVDGPRGHHYGPPQVNHERTAELWHSYMIAKYGSACWGFTPEDVCNLNILQKMSRDMHNPTRDNLVDQIGYLINLAKLREEDD